MYVTDIRHFLGEAGEVPDDLPRPAQRLFELLSTIVADVTESCVGTEPILLSIPCRRRPARRKCSGPVFAGYSVEDPTVIAWECVGCGDCGIISGWENTVWDNRNARQSGKRPARSNRRNRRPNSIPVSDLVGLLVFRPNDLYDFVRLWSELGDLSYQRKGNSGKASLTVYGLTRAFSSFVDAVDGGLPSLVSQVLTEAGLPMEAVIVVDD